MSVEPEFVPEVITATPLARPPWHTKLLRTCFAIFCLEIGLFLVIFPWSDMWNFNYLQAAAPVLESLWDQAYFRGAITGLGLVNVYIAFLQLFELLKRRG
jgi:hypothetical protein